MENIDEEDTVGKCKQCGKAHAVDDLYECDECEEGPYCEDCIHSLDNAGIVLCPSCRGGEERIVEKIVEKPIYIKENSGESVAEAESMEAFERRILTY